MERLYPKDIPGDWKESTICNIAAGKKITQVCCQNKQFWSHSFQLLQTEVDSRAFSQGSSSEQHLFFVHQQTKQCQSVLLITKVQVNVNKRTLHPISYLLPTDKSTRKRTSRYLLLGKHLSIYLFFLENSVVNTHKCFHHSLVLLHK